MYNQDSVGFNEINLILSVMQPREVYILQLLFTKFSVRCNVHTVHAFYVSSSTCGYLLYLLFLYVENKYTQTTQTVDKSSETSSDFRIFLYHILQPSKVMWLDIQLTSIAQGQFVINVSTADFLTTYAVARYYINQKNKKFQRQRQQSLPCSEV